MRIHRIGQKRTVRVRRFIVRVSFAHSFSISSLRSMGTSKPPIVWCHVVYVSKFAFYVIFSCSVVKS